MSFTTKKIFRPIMLACLMAFFPLIGTPISASAAGPGMGDATSKGTYEAICDELQTGTVVCTIKVEDVKVTCTASSDFAVLTCTRDIKKEEIKRTFRVDIPSK